MICHMNSILDHNVKLTDVCLHVTHVEIKVQCSSYHRSGKIRWAKHLRFRPYEVFRGNIASYFRGALATSVHYLATYS